MPRMHTDQPDVSVASYNVSAFMEETAAVPNILAEITDADAQYGVAIRPRGTPRLIVSGLSDTVKNALSKRGP